MRLHYDTVIIGTGFGGSITACRIAEARKQAGNPVSVCVLERGKRYHMGEFPRDVGRTKEWWWRNGGRKGWTGLLEFRDFNGIGVLVGSGVGGTSLLYLDVQIDAFRSTFDQVDEHGNRRWPASVANWYDELAPYYRKLVEMLHPVPIPEPPMKARVMKAGAASVGDGDRFRLLDVAVYYGQDGCERGVLHPDPFHRGGPAQVGCRYCGECYIGCNSHSKNTVDLNYLWFAERSGAEVYSQHKVNRISRDGSGYTVHFEDVRWGFEGAISANRVIVAAGPLGSSELLLRCKRGYRDRGKRFDATLPDLSDRLGTGFSGNGDFAAMATKTNREADPMLGPTITAVLDYRDKLNDHGFLIEDGGFPDVLRHSLRRLPGGLAQGRRLLFALKDLLGRDENRKLVEGLFNQIDFDTIRDGLAALVMGHDAANGRMGLDDEGNLTIDWPAKPSMRFFREVEATLRAIAENPDGLDGNLATPPPWWANKHLVTVHPLGGCPMGDSDTQGVVDTYGAVHGYPGLYVLDGSIVPSAIGPNPSKTIGALAERGVEHMIRTGVV